MGLLKTSNIQQRVQEHNANEVGWTICTEMIRLIDPDAVQILVSDEILRTLPVSMNYTSSLLLQVPCPARLARQSVDVSISWREVAYPTTINGASPIVNGEKRQHCDAILSDGNHRPPKRVQSKGAHAATCTPLASVSNLAASIPTVPPQIDAAVEGNLQVSALTSTFDDILQNIQHSEVGLTPMQVSTMTDTQSSSPEVEMHTSQHVKIKELRLRYQSKPSAQGLKIFTDSNQTDPMISGTDLAGSGNQWKMDPFRPLDSAYDLAESGYTWNPR